MANLTIRDLDECFAEALRERATRHGRSMEEEAHVILRQTLAGTTGVDLWTRSRTLFAGSNAVDLEIPSRAADRPPLMELSDDAEPFGDWLVAISRPGFDLDDALDLIRSSPVRSAPLE